MPDLSGNGEISALAGPTFMETWGPRSTKQFFDYISAAMPYGQPSLTTEAYTEITAFILQSNGAVAGETALSASTAVIIRRPCRNTLTPAAGVERRLPWRAVARSAKAAACA